MLPKELYSKIQKFHFRTRFLANDLFAGQYISAFKGKGMEFAEVREYQPGDDVRDIDWNVTARFGHPFVKIFSEERELTVILVVDCSLSNLFGTESRFKRELIAEVCGLLSFVAMKTNDRVGAILFSDGVDRFIPPQKGPGHVWRMIKEIFTHKAQASGTDLASPLRYLARVVRRHAIVFYLSDFLTDSYDKNFFTAVSIAAKKHDLTAIRITDPAERVLPNVGLAWLKDPESGKAFPIDTNNKKLRKKWKHEVEKNDRILKRMLNGMRVDLVELSTGGSVTETLAGYFRSRESRQY